MAPLTYIHTYIHDLLDRKFMSDDQDDATATNTFDATGFDFF